MSWMRAVGFAWLCLFLSLVGLGELNIASAGESSADSNNPCVIELSLDPISRSFTKYLEERLSFQDLEWHQIERFMAIAMAEYRYHNPMPDSSKLQGPKGFVQYQTFELFGKQKLDLELIIAWLEFNKNRLVGESTEKDELSIEAQFYHEPMNFALVPASAGENGSNFDNELELTHSYFMQTGPVTQGQWMEVMGSNPSAHKTHDMNHPAENMSFWSQLEFLNRRSELDGLIPAYDISELEFTGNAADGSLALVKGSRGLIKFNSPDGSLYKTEGYRLPTGHEFDLFLLQLKTGFGENALEAIRDEPDLYAWTASNSLNMTTQPVGTREAFFIGDSAFYDVIGNVSVRLFDGPYPFNTYPSGKDIEPKLGWYVEADRGTSRGSSSSSGVNSALDFFSNGSPWLNSRQSGLGLRIVKSNLKKNGEGQ